MSLTHEDESVVQQAVFQCSAAECLSEVKDPFQREIRSEREYGGRRLM